MYHYGWNDREWDMAWFLTRDGTQQSEILLESGENQYWFIICLIHLSGAKVKFRRRKNEVQATDYPRPDAYDKVLPKRLTKRGANWL